MANKSKPSLTRTHHYTARELRWIYESPDDWPKPPRCVKQQASLYLNRLVKDAGIDRTGLNPEETYLKAVRAIIEAAGFVTSPAARRLQNVVSDWDKSRQKIWDTRRAGKGDAPSDVTTFTLDETWGREPTEFGFLGGDRLELENADAPRPGEVLAVSDESGVAFGRFVRFENSFHGRVIVLDTADGEGSHLMAGSCVRRPLRVTRRYEAPAPTSAGGGDAPSPEAQQRIEELRRRLDKLYEPENEAARFRIEREIYDLTRAGACAEEEWPEVVAA